MSRFETKNAAQIVKSSLDIIVLKMLNENPKHGYQLLADIHREFDVLLSPGTLYPLLYHLEEENLIEKTIEKRRKIYSLTNFGTKKALEIVRLYKKNVRHIMLFLENKST